MSDEGGFTLTEALVTLALGMSVVSAGLTTLKSASNGAAKAAFLANEVETFAEAGLILEGDALHAQRLRDVNSRLVFLGTAQVLIFPSLPRFAAGRLELLRFELRPSGTGIDLIRSAAVLLSSGENGPFGTSQVIWHGVDRWEFRYLDTSGTWQRQWTAATMPHAFGVVSTISPLTVELVSAFPDLIEPDCATGPGPECSLPSGDFR